MLTLSKGFLKPEDGDKGSVFFDALESNIQQMNDHTHDGLNSSKLPTTAFNHNSSSIPAGSWVAVAGKPGLYRQLITLPFSLFLGNIGMYFIAASGNIPDIEGHVFYPTVEQVTTSSFYVYLNDNTISLRVVYV